MQRLAQVVALMAERVDLRQEKETLLMALYLRARDSQARHPVLGDPYAQGLVERIDYDFDRLAHLRGNTALIVARARQLDIWTEEFLAAHPSGLVLHLACGLDSRPLRGCQADLGGVDRCGLPRGHRAATPTL